MPAKVGYLAIDTVDPNSLAPFWCELLGVHVDTTIGEGEFLILSPTDLDTATAEVEKLGGRWLEPGETRELEGFQWRCMADPEGNEFDLDMLPAGS